MGFLAVFPTAFVAYPAGVTDVATFAIPDVNALVPSGFLTHATITPITIQAATIATTTMIIVND